MKSKLFINNKNIEWEEVAPGVRRKILGYDSELMMVHVAFDKGAVGSLHTHPHRQVSYVESGSFEVTISDEKKVLAKGDSFFAPSDSEHGVVALEEGSLIDIFNPVREDFLSSSKEYKTGYHLILKS